MNATPLKHNSRQRTFLIVAATAVLAVCATLAVLVSTGLLALPSRQAEVAARGAQVMPFDQNKTKHIFQDQADGGVQQVVALDPKDTEQITRIRQHLQAEAAKFRRGDFADPASIHGTAMPGLAELQASGGKIAVVYSELPDGAQIVYATGDQSLVMALHYWFAAQISDHGNHAMGQ